MRPCRFDGPIEDRGGPCFDTSYLPGEDAGFDLGPHGYVEQEYLVSGSANLYDRGPDGSARPVAEQPYVTRLLVRHPGDSRRFSGRLFFEGNHPGNDRPLTWASLHEWLVGRRHAWAGVTIFPMGVEALKAYDPERYSAVELGGDGVRWDVLGQAAALVRSPGGPLKGLRVDRVYASGWSYTGSLWRTYVAEGLHREARLEDGAPVFDGYVIGISAGAVDAGYLSLSAEAPPLPREDPRRIVAPQDVPVIELLSECEAVTNRLARRPDSDDPADRYRYYEVAGASHINWREGARPRTVADLQLAARGVAVPAMEIVETPNGFPMEAVAACVFDNLDRWATDGVAPPHAERFRFLGGEEGVPAKGLPGSEAIARDEHGNAVGGLRTPQVDVPAARYVTHSTTRSADSRPRTPEGRLVDPGNLTGHKEPFTPEKMRALYSTPDRYADLVAKRAAELVAERFLLALDAERIVAEAAEVSF